MGGSMKKRSSNVKIPLMNFTDYLKICRGSADIPFHDPDPLDLEGVLKKFSKYSQIDLISTLSGLQLYPENHSQTLRLGYATKVACQKISKGQQNIKRKEFKKLLNTYLPAHGDIGIREDPPECHFTQNFVYHGGNYIVFSAYSEGEDAILHDLLSTIQINRDIFPRNYLVFIETSAFALLTMSNAVAIRLNYSRNIASPDNWRENILLPEISEMERLRNATVFSDSDIRSLLNPSGLDETSLMPFFCHVGESSLSEGEVNKNPLHERPLAKIDGNTIVAYPSIMMSAIRHNILISAEKIGIRDLLLEKYSDHLWTRVCSNLKFMSYGQIKIQLPKIQKNLPVRDGVFRFDSDKVAYIQLITDNGSEYPEHEINGAWDTSSISDQINDRMDRIVRELKRDKSQKILVIIVLGRIGRSFKFGLHKPCENVLLIPFEELEIIAKLRDLDNLSLWKYSIAENKFNETTESFSWGFLDKYALYRQNDYSLAIIDENIPSFLNVTPGTGRFLRMKSVSINDIHLALKDNPPLYLSVMRRFDDENIPIFLPEDFSGMNLDHLVEGYYQPIWVGPKTDSIKIKSLCGILDTYLGITEMLSYWLWQLTPELKDHLKILGSNPIQLSYILDCEYCWKNITLEKTAEGNQEINFTVTVDGNEILFHLPPTIIPFFSRIDNEGERLITKALLNAFGNLLVSRGKENTLNDARCCEIIEKIAPLGLKKKFLLLDTILQTSLNPKNLPCVRLLQQHDINQQMENLNEIISKISQSINETTDPKSKNITICNSLVDFYYQRLLSEIAPFSAHNLLFNLIKYHEAICYSRANKRFTIPTAIACFYGIEAMVKKETEEMPHLDGTSVSIRSLIEIIAANPPDGKKNVSLDDFDRLLAITNRLIHFGMVSDHIRYGIVDFSVNLLQSGKVTIDHSNEIWAKFYESKTSEYVYQSTEHHADFYADFQGKSTPSNDMLVQENVFKKEFGLTLTEIVSFFNALTEIGLQSPESVAILSLSEFKEVIKNMLSWGDDQIDCAIRIFSLSPREKWEIPPDGFSKNDIWPWRYNRSLSFLRRPLVISRKPDEKIYWGPRHADEAGRELYSLIHSGRYNTEKSSKEMKEYVGKIVNENGHEFTKAVKKWFEINTDWLVDYEIPIKPGKDFNSDTDLGDIDVLLIDKQKKRLFSIECKDINFGRSPHEINQEIERFIEDKKSYVQKHKNRELWLSNNIESINRKYSLGYESMEIISCIITSVEIPTPYLKDSSMKFISYFKLKIQGLAALN